MEKLRLPEPARSLWNAKRDIVHSLPDEGTGRAVRPHLGGGTTLAARWGHRRSTDIDILLPGRNTLIDLAQDNDDNIARRLGGKPEAVSGGRIKIAFSEGKIDLSTLRPSPSLGQQEAAAAALQPDRGDGRLRREKPAPDPRAAGRRRRPAARRRREKARKTAPARIPDSAYGA